MGLSLEWALYHTNALIRCPGTRPDRRTEIRGDRRTASRPCGHSFGRVVSGSVAVRLLLRLNAHDRPNEAPIVVLCPSCSAQVEFLTVAAKAA